MKITVSTDYIKDKDFLTGIPSQFNESKGTVLFNGRNEIRSFSRDRIIIVAKRFKKPDIIKKIIYSSFRKDKAIRSYTNAKKIIRRGFDTPHPIAYIREDRFFLIDYVYYICEYTDSKPIQQALCGKDTFDKELATEFGRYVAQMHLHGIMHHDLNCTNVLYKIENGRYIFTLIDINRMTFKKEDKSFTKHECLNNLTLFSELNDAFKTVLHSYIDSRGWAKETFEEGLKIKMQHDAYWKRKKRLTGIFKSKRRH